MTYPYSHGCGPNPKKNVDKYWKYQNDDPSTEYYSNIIIREIFQRINDDIDEEGKRIYNLRPKAILVQDLRHAVIRKLAKGLALRVREIEQYERFNSFDRRGEGDRRL